jgi:hypothetical protein
MKLGIHISVLYNDEHLLKLRVSASNGVFAGQADVYADSDALAEMAGTLKGFPNGRDDEREFEMGTFDENCGLPLLLCRLHRPRLSSGKTLRRRASGGRRE